mgnify:CR=1 FL=1
MSTGPLFIADAVGCKTAVIGTDCAYDQSPQTDTVIVQAPGAPVYVHIMYPPERMDAHFEPAQQITVAMMQEAFAAQLKKIRV